MSELSIQAHRRPHIWHNNPALVQLLGLSPLLAITTTTTQGFALGVSSAFVLLLSSITVTLCQSLLAPQWRFVFYLFVLSVFTSVVDLVMRQYFYALHRELGHYVPLICCNFALLLHLDTQLPKNPTWQMLTPSLITGAGIVFSLVAFAAIRELIIYSAVLTDWYLLLPAASAAEQPIIAPAPVKIEFAKLAPAAFILFGLLLALKNLLQPHSSNFNDTDATTPVTRARVTGKIQLP